MSFEQKVLIRGVEPLDVIRGFHDRKFGEFLTALQPVKKKSWRGINDEMEASFSFWFFGWREIRVVHRNYRVTRNPLEFEELGMKLPFGLSHWNHHHIVELHEEGTVIVDKVEKSHQSLVKRNFKIPIKGFPGFKRRLTKRMGFKQKEGKTGEPFKRLKPQEKIKAI
jgi:hypothetical protein